MDQVVQVPVGGAGQLQCSEADVLDSIVNKEGPVDVLHQLVDRGDGVVRLLPNLGDEESKSENDLYKASTYT